MEICGIDVDFSKKNGYFINADCMEGMKQFPDKFFDLAIVDTPYGINVGQASMGAGGGVAPHTNRSARLRTGGGNRQNIPFGGKRNPKFASAEQSRSERNNPGGRVNASHPKSIRHSMTATHRMPNISRNLSEWQNTGLYGVAITFLIIWVQQAV